MALKTKTTSKSDSKLFRWGNGLGVLFDKQLLKRMKWKRNDLFEFWVEDDAMYIQKVKPRKRG